MKKRNRNKRNKRKKRNAVSLKTKRARVHAKTKKLARDYKNYNDQNVDWAWRYTPIEKLKQLRNIKGKNFV